MKPCKPGCGLLESAVEEVFALGSWAGPLLACFSRYALQLRSSLVVQFAIIDLHRTVFLGTRRTNWSLGAWSPKPASLLRSSSRFDLLHVLGFFGSLGNCVPPTFGPERGFRIVVGRDVYDLRGAESMLALPAGARDRHHMYTGFDRQRCWTRFIAVVGLLSLSPLKRLPR